MDAEAVVVALETDAVSGLREMEAQSRLAKLGRNEFGGKEREPLWRKFVAQLQETLILLLLASAFVSLCMGQYDDAISITLAITIVVTVAAVQEHRSELSLKALSNLMPFTCNCIREGALRDMLAPELGEFFIIILF